MACHPTVHQLSGDNLSFCQVYDAHLRLARNEEASTKAASDPETEEDEIQDEILDCDRIFCGADGVEREYDEHVAHMREMFPLNDRFLDMSEITQDFLFSWKSLKQELDVQVVRRGGGTLQNLQPHDHLNAEKALQHLQDLLNRELTREGAEEAMLLGEKLSVAQELLQAHKDLEQELLGNIPHLQRDAQRRQQELENARAVLAEMNRPGQASNFGLFQHHIRSRLPDMQEKEGASVIANFNLQNMLFHARQTQERITELWAAIHPNPNARQQDIVVNQAFGNAKCNDPIEELKELKQFDPNWASDPHLGSLCQHANRAKAEAVSLKYNAAKIDEIIPILKREAAKGPTDWSPKLVAFMERIAQKHGCPCGVSSICLLNTCGCSTSKGMQAYADLKKIEKGQENMLLDANLGTTLQNAEAARQEKNMYTEMIGLASMHSRNKAYAAAIAAYDRSKKALDQEIQAATQREGFFDTIWRRVGFPRRSDNERMYSIMCNTYGRVKDSGAAERQRMFTRRQHWYQTHIAGQRPVEPGEEFLGHALEDPEERQQAVKVPKQQTMAGIDDPVDILLQKMSGSWAISEETLARVSALRTIPKQTTASYTGRQDNDDALTRAIEHASKPLTNLRSVQLDGEVAIMADGVVPKAELPSAPVMDSGINHGPQSSTEVYLNPDYVARFYGTVLQEQHTAGKLETLKKKVIEAARNLDPNDDGAYGAEGNTSGELALKVLKNTEKYTQRIQDRERQDGMQGSLDYWGHLFNEDKKEV